MRTPPRSSCQLPIDQIFEIIVICPRGEPTQRIHLDVNQVASPLLGVVGAAGSSLGTVCVRTRVANDRLENDSVFAVPDPDILVSETLVRMRGIC